MSMSSVTTTKQNKTSDLKSQVELSGRTDEAAGLQCPAVSGIRQRGGVAIATSPLPVFANSQATNSGVAVAVAGGAAGPLNLTSRKKSASCLKARFQGGIGGV